MLRNCLLGFALVLALAGACAWRAGWPQALPVTFYGTVLILAVLCERWRYHGRTGVTASLEWEDTDERFRDPASDQWMQVQFNPRTGQRRYLDARSGRASNAPPL